MEFVRQKNQATYIYFPLVDADGDPVTSAGSLDSNWDGYSDGAAPNGFTACTNEATEIGTTGSYYLLLTATEMDNDYVLVYIASTSAKTQWIAIRTMTGDPLLLATTASGALVWSSATRAITDKTNMQIASGGIPVGAFVTASITADAIAANAITSSEFAQSAADLVWGTAARALTDKIDFSILAANRATLIDEMWDENVVTAHDAAQTAGRLLEDLGALISARTNNSNLNVLLGVPDTIGVDIPEQVWAEGTRAITDKAGFTISGTTQTFDALDTLLDAAHGAGSWLSATGFSTHTAAAVWSVATRALTDKAGFTISGTTQTFDALDTLLDAAHGAGSWLTGGAGGATIQVTPSIPKNIDLADTKTVRIALYLTDQNDDLPTTVEITPGTIKIERSADGGTSWTIIRSDVACSEHAGGIYYDETFSSGNGYASADMIKITFKSQKVVIAANDHEICDATDGMVFITRMDSGLSGGGPSAGDIADAVWNELIADHIGATTFGGKNQLVVPSETIADYKADVSALATEANASTNTSNIQTNIDANETKIDSVISDTDRLRYRGSVWIDDTAANTNTVLGTDGVPENPVSTLAAALTIATALNVQSLVLMNNSSISLSQSFADWVIIGHGYNNIVTLNTQSVDNAMIYNCQVTGTQAGTGSVLLEHCYLDSIINLRCTAFYCLLIGNLTIVAATNIFFNHCSSAVAGNSTPIITFSAGVTAVSFRGYSGGIEIKTMTVDHTMSLETDGQIILNVDCTGGALSIRGNMTITDNSGNVTITQGAALNRDVIADATWDELIAGHTGGTTFGGKNQLAVPSETLADYKATGFSTHSAAAVWAVGTRALTDKIDFGLSAADKLLIADDVWDESVSEHVVSGSVSEFIRRIAGLAFDNAAWEFTFTGDNQTGGGIWLYDTAGNLATHNKSTGKIGEYTYTCTFSGDKPQVMKISKVS